MKRIVLTGGGTAGHVTPNLALIPFLKKDGWEIHYVGTAGSIEQKLIAGVPGIAFHAVSSGKLRRYFDLKNFTDPFRVVKGAFQAWALIAKLKPQLVFSKGGFVAVPVVVGAKMNRVPVIIHESDMTIGLSNKLSVPFADKVLTTFPEAAKALGEKGVHTGTPLREELFSGDREKGLAMCGFQSSKPVLMVTGGSTGAQAINAALRGALEPLLNCFQILHLCGRGNLDTSLQGRRGYCQIEYLEKGIEDAYAAADVLISRAGSNTLCEILALQKPALLIPYPMSASRGDQVENARSFRDRGLSTLLMQEEMTPQTLEEAVVRTYHNRGALIGKMRAEQSASGTMNVVEIIRKYDREHSARKNPEPVRANSR